VIFSFFSYFVTLQSEAVKVYNFWGNGEQIKEPNDTHYATLEEDPKKSLPNAFTICSSMYFGMGTASGTWFTLYTSEEPPKSWFTLYATTAFTDYYMQDELHVNGIYEIAFNKYEWDSEFWAHCCMAVDLESGNVTVVRNGHIGVDRQMESFRNVTLKPNDLSGRIFLGLWHMSRKETVWHELAKMSNLNIYSKKLSIEEMKEITNGSRCGEEGDYLAWSKNQLGFHRKCHQS